MDFGHLEMRCGPHRILVPGEDILCIDPPMDRCVAVRSLHRARRQGWTLVIDGRRLLGLPSALPGQPQLAVQWRTVAPSPGAILVVDEVEGFRGNIAAECLPLPLVPADFHKLFDRLVHDSEGGFLLRLRRQVRPVHDDVGSKRRFCRAVIGNIPPDPMFSKIEGHCDGRSFGEETHPDRR